MIDFLFRCIWFCFAITMIFIVALTILILVPIFALLFYFYNLFFIDAK